MYGTVQDKDSEGGDDRVGNAILPRMDNNTMDPGCELCALRGTED